MLPQCYQKCIHRKPNEQEALTLSSSCICDLTIYFCILKDKFSKNLQKQQRDRTYHQLLQRATDLNSCSGQSSTASNKQGIYGFSPLHAVTSELRTACSGKGSGTCVTKGTGSLRGGEGNYPGGKSARGEVHRRH